MPMTVAEVLAILETFPWDEWNERLGPGLSQHYRDILTKHGAAGAKAAGGTWNPSDPFLSKFATGYVGERITQLDETTRAEVAAAIRTAFDEAKGASIQQLADTIGDTVREKFKGYEQFRALRIARSESAIAANHGNVFGYAQAGVTEVDVLDGTGDDICSAANGQRWSLRQSIANPIGHPNCQRALNPVLPDLDTEGRRRAAEAMSVELADQDVVREAATAAARIGGMDDPMGRVLDPDDDDGTA